jgi:hypothetical protein
MSIVILPNLACCMHELFIRTCFFHIRQLASPINLDILYHSQLENTGDEL